MENFHPETMSIYPVTWEALWKGRATWRYCLKEKDERAELKQVLEVVGKNALETSEGSTKT